MAGHEANISSIAWNPLNENIIASSCIDKEFCLWDIEKENLTLQCNLSSHVVFTQWNQLDAGSLLLLLASGEIIKFITQLKNIEHIYNAEEIKPTIIRWHPKNVNMCVFHCRMISLLYVERREHLYSTAFEKKLK